MKKNLPPDEIEESRRRDNRDSQARHRKRRADEFQHLQQGVRERDANLRTLREAYNLTSQEISMLRERNEQLERIMAENGKPAFLLVAFCPSRDIHLC